MFCFHWTHLSSEPSVIFTLPKAGVVRQILELHQNCEEEPKLPNISYLVISIVRAEVSSRYLPGKPYILEFYIVAGREPL